MLFYNLTKFIIYQKIKAHNFNFILKQQWITIQTMFIFKLSPNIDINQISIDKNIFDELDLISSSFNGVRHKESGLVQNPVANFSRDWKLATVLF